MEESRTSEEFTVFSTRREPLSSSITTSPKSPAWLLPWCHYIYVLRPVSLSEGWQTCKSTRSNHKASAITSMSAQAPPVPPIATGVMALPMPVQGDQQDPYTAPLKKADFPRWCAFRKLARRTLGIILLLTVVVLWTTSNFLTSVRCKSFRNYREPQANLSQDIFADDSYSKPFLLTYVNVAIFVVALVPLFIRTARANGLSYIKHESIQYCRSKFTRYRGVYIQKERNADAEETAALMSPQDGPMTVEDGGAKVTTSEEIMTIRETADVALEFCIIFFIANYFVAACLGYTSVGSATILTSTSSIFTLVFAAVWGVEVFKVKNLIGVLCSFSGVVLISLVDLSKKDNDENRGSFPHKSSAEIAMGNVMAIGSAIVYGIYAVIIKKRVGNEERVDMLSVFGFVGLFSILLIWPGFFILHFIGLERFQLPPSETIWFIVMVCHRILLIQSLLTYGVGELRSLTRQ